MAKQLQLRRGTTQANALFTGAQGEITMDTEKNLLRVHDGTTPGGFMIDTVVAFQAPTASNNRTWYRKYASGWVEQGGILTAAHNSNGLYTLPIEMADTYYSARAGCAQVSSSGTFGASSTVAAAPGSTTQVRVGQANGGSAAMEIWWEVKGLAA